MHKVIPTIEEVIALTKQLTVKNFSAKLAKSGIWVYLWTLETIVSPAPKFMKICTLVDHDIRNKFSFESGD
jgi:hypothetical protein